MYFNEKASQHELNLTWTESVFMLCFIEQKASSTYALEGIVKDFVLIYLQRSLICYFVRLFNNELHIYIWCAWQIWYGFSGLTGRKVYAIFREVTPPPSLPQLVIKPSCTKAGGMTPKRFFKHNSVKNKPKPAKFLLIQVW